MTTTPSGWPGSVLRPPHSAAVRVGQPFGLVIQIWWLPAGFAASASIIRDATEGQRRWLFRTQFLVVSATARLWCLHTPGCCRAFYWNASEPIGVDDPSSGTVDFALVRSSAKTYGGIVILGPPPFINGG